MCLFFCFLIATWNSHDWKIFILIGVFRNHTHFIDLYFLVDTSQTNALLIKYPFKVLLQIRKDRPLPYLNPLKIRKGTMRKDFAFLIVPLFIHSGSFYS
jgi:hypothetical protein